MDGLISFRPATPEDGEAMLAIHRAAIMASDQAVYPPDILASWAFGLTAGGYGAAMAEGGDFEVAQTGEGRVVAFCSVRNGEISGLFVHPDAQMRGIGAMLVERGERRAAPQRTELPVRR